MSHLMVFDLSCFLWKAVYGNPTAKVGIIAAEAVAKVLRQHRPTHAVAAADLPWPTWRHDLVPSQYKANRREGRERERTVVQGQTAFCREILEDVYGVPTFSAKGYEADDVIATLVTVAPAELTTVVAVDKDFLQLVREDLVTRVQVLNPQTGDVWDAETIQQQWGVWPSQFVAYQALVGDSADGYSGCPGIGPKQAVQLIGQYFTLEGILAAGRRVAASDTAAELFSPSDEEIILRIPKPTGVFHKQLKLVSEGRKQIALSEKYASLQRDVPRICDVKLDDLVLPPLPKRDTDVLE